VIFQNLLREEGGRDGKRVGEEKEEFKLLLFPSLISN
jgi:hypothetical protein